MGGTETLDDEKATFIAAAKRYEARRSVAREMTQATMFNLAMSMEAPFEAARLDLMPIIDHALEMADSWNFPWRGIVGQYRPYLRRFEIALWFEGEVYGLAVGRASRGPDNVTIHFLERRPGDNVFKGWVAKIVTDAADNYAKILQRQMVKLKNPVADAIPHYESLTFSLAETTKGNTYYERRVL